jgi:hypothetical protein
MVCEDVVVVVEVSDKEDVELILVLDVVLVLTEVE